MSVTNVHACMHVQDFTSVKSFQPVVRKSLPTKLCLWLSAQLKYFFYSLLKRKGRGLSYIPVLLKTRMLMSKYSNNSLFFQIVDS